MSVTGAARGTSQRRLFYRCGASIYRGRGRLGAVRSVCRTAGLGVGRAGVCSHPGRMLLRGGDAFDCRSTASVRSEVRSTHRARPFAPGAGAPTGWGGAFDCRSTASVRSEGKPKHRACPIRTRGGCASGWGGAFDCRSTASVRSEGKPIHRACLIRTRGGCSYRVEVTRSVVGAPPRCEAKANQYTEPVRSHPGRVLLQGGGDAFSCRSTASVRSEGKPIHRASPIRTRGRRAYRMGGRARSEEHRLGAKRRQTNTPSLPYSHPGRVLLQGGGDAFNCRSTASVRTESNQYTEPAHSHPGRVLLPVLRGNEKAPASFDARAFDMAQR